MVGSVCRYSASAIALSNARREPDPMEKCPVAAASPISTTFSWYQRSQITRGKFIHTAEPRRWCAFDINAWPPRCFAKTRSHVATVSSFDICSKPHASHVCCVHSTITVAVFESNW